MKFLKNILSLFGESPRRETKWKMTHDAAFTFRMGAGFAGAVTRTHPVGIEPCLISVANPITAFGQAVLVDSGDTNKGMRPLSSGDQAATTIEGVTVRPFPFQQQTTSNLSGAVALGTPGTPPGGGNIVDILRQGYILVSVVGTPVKGGAVFIWTAANSGQHVQGGFEAATPGGNGMGITGVGSGKTFFNGGPDANGLVELAYNI